jgi:hypothetical protein
VPKFSSGEAFGRVFDFYSRKTLLDYEILKAEAEYDFPASSEPVLMPRVRSLEGWSNDVVAERRRRVDAGLDDDLTYVELYKMLKKRAEKPPPMSVAELSSKMDSHFVEVRSLLEGQSEALAVQGALVTEQLVERCVRQMNRQGRVLGELLSFVRSREMSKDWKSRPKNATPPPPPPPSIRKRRNAGELPYGEGTSLLFDQTQDFCKSFNKMGE